MTTKEALALVIELAEQNTLYSDDAKRDETLRKEATRQRRALSLVAQLQAVLT